MPPTRSLAPSSPTPDSPDKCRYCAQPIQLEMWLLSECRYLIGARRDYAAAPAETTIGVW